MEFLDSFEYPFYHQEETIIPPKDEVWQLFIRIRERINKLQEIIQTQQKELELLKELKMQRVHKVAIVEFPIETMLEKMIEVKEKYEKKPVPNFDAEVED